MMRRQRERERETILANSVVSCEECVSHSTWLCVSGPGNCAIATVDNSSALEQCTSL